LATLLTALLSALTRLLGLLSALLTTLVALLSALARLLGLLSALLTAALAALLATLVLLICHRRFPFGVTPSTMRWPAATFLG
jgi:hypothetical protein